LPSPWNRPRCTVTVRISSNGWVLAEYISEQTGGGSGQTEYDWSMFSLVFLPNNNPVVGAAEANHN